MTPQSQSQKLWCILQTLTPLVWELCSLAIETNVPSNPVIQAKQPLWDLLCAARSSWTVISLNSCRRDVAPGSRSPNSAAAQPTLGAAVAGGAKINSQPSLARSLARDRKKWTWSAQWSLVKQHANILMFTDSDSDRLQWQWGTRKRGGDLTEAKRLCFRFGLHQIEPLWAQFAHSRRLHPHRLLRSPSCLKVSKALPADLTTLPTLILSFAWQATFCKLRRAAF